MPAKNVVKQFSSGDYYHVYNRGVAKQNIFHDQSDKRYFLSLFDRHLNPSNTSTDKSGVPYKKFDTNLELLCYCLMGNHYHMLFYLGEDANSISEIMRSIGAAYTMYYNLKYKRVGPLFQGTYKAVRISSDSYLLHITRYIHLNPREYKTYKYSSLPVYLNSKEEPWLKPGKILSLFEGDNYLEFLKDYEDKKAIGEELASELANK